MIAEAFEKQFTASRSLPPPPPMPPPPPSIPITAELLLKTAVKEMNDRAVQRDSPLGERSMGRAVAAFNSLTGHSLTEGEGWLLLEVLKLARSTSHSGIPRMDDYVDAAAYSALRGEWELRNEGSGDIS